MLACATSAVLSGVEAIGVDVEVSIAQGLPTFNIVGLPDTSVSEARDRVRAALAHSGQEFPLQRVTVNLAPSDVPKHGPALDLAVALALLAANRKLPADGLRDRLFLGELGLGGEVRAVRGSLASAEVARMRRIGQVVCPSDNASEAAMAGVAAVPVSTLKDAIEVVKGHRTDAVTACPDEYLSEPASGDLDLAQIRGQDQAKRAIEIAAAGGHNLLLSGPPGAGKTLLARALPAILPRMMLTEALEVTRIHSAAGLLPTGEGLVRARPFRAPHHGVSVAGLVGGGTSWVRPGEVTLAHRGVLFLDEFAEFPRSCLEALRQPIEDGRVTVSRSRQTVTYPARIMLVAAMNPCPCGHRDSDTPCRCTPYTLHAYRQRISGPLLDRIDLHVSVGRVESEDLLEEVTAERSDDVRDRVEAARTLAAERLREIGASCNAEIGPGRVLAFCGPDRRGARALERAARSWRLSARAIHRSLRVARTIADLAGRDGLCEDDVLEALTYRVPQGEVRT